jgi:hypothetical protein
MKLSKKNLPTLLLLLFLGMLIGSLAWELLERLIHYLGSDFSLTLKNAIQLFDIYVLSLWFRANPGTLVGLIGGAVLFWRI